MSENASLPAFYSSLLRIHAVITRGLNVTLENSQIFSSTGFPDTQTQTGFYRYVHSLLTLLHTHHKAEEHIAFPYVQARIPSLRIEPLTMQHHQMLPHHERMKSVLERLKTDPDPKTTLTELATICANLRILWMMHKSAEEGYFISSSQTAHELSTAEQTELTLQTAEYNQKHGEPVQWLVPFILYNLPPAEREQMEQSMPPHLTKVLIPIVWKNEWMPMKPFFIA